MQTEDPATLPGKGAERTLLIPAGEAPMKSRTVIATVLLLAATGALRWAHAEADSAPMPGIKHADTLADTGGMTMKMTLPPMPAIYAGVPDRPGAPMFEGYGDHHHAITTANSKTQAYFDQGVRLLFGFNHAE